MKSQVKMKLNSFVQNFNKFKGRFNKQYGGDKKKKRKSKADDLYDIVIDDDDDFCRTDYSYSFQLYHNHFIICIMIHLYTN